MEISYEYKRASAEDADQIYELVQDTIKRIYPGCYPREVVMFFLGLHSRERIVDDMNHGVATYTLWGEGRLLGTGSHEGRHITRVYVDPDFQGKGYGSTIMQKLEDEIALRYDSADLDASVPARRLYGHRGYKTIKHETCEVPGGVLAYEVMEKQFCRQKRAANKGKGEDDYDIREDEAVSGE